MDLMKTLLILVLTLQIIDSSLSYQFVTKFKIGTPPRDVTTGISTGNDLSWIQCEPCDSCRPQTDPIFNPRNSSSFKSIQCNSKDCPHPPNREISCDSENQCAFDEEDDDMSSIKGIYATENMIYDDQKFSDLKFGCVHDQSSDGFGILGLGIGNDSFITQYENLTHDRFSYCIPQQQNGDEITMVKFGDNATVSGDFTPITTQYSYRVNLLDMSVGNERLNWEPLDWHDNTMINAGSMTSNLLGAFYDSLVAKLNETVKLVPSPQSPTSAYQLCYKGTQKDLIAPKVPDLTFHFEGLNVTVPAYNAFISVDKETVCLGFFQVPDVQLFGGLLQQGLNVGFDLKAKRIYMQQGDCGKV